MTPGIRVRGISGLVANLHTLKVGVDKGVREAMERTGREQYAATVAAAPKRTGFMADHTRLEFSPEGLTYTIGYADEDFTNAGLEPYFYYVILGTSRQAANDFLFREHEAHRAQLTRDVGDAVRGAARDVSR